MSSHRYPSLPDGSIRLLRLMPHQDKRSRIQCQLFDCNLSDSEDTYPYEALSYVWGSEDKPQSIYIANYDCDMPVGTNLYEALLRFRNRFIEQILWVDAICINQEDLHEKGQQVQFMAKIYAKASRVIVWLGEAADDSDRALEGIRIAGAEQSAKSSIGKANEQVTLALLQRPWFQRIWVLQEVAAARHVLIKCGPTEIDGYAFCSGLNELKLSYESCPGLQALIYSITYLIRGAIFRPRRVTSQSGGKFSLDIRPLSELVDMYHTRKATKPHDKIYALLGMSSDDLSTSGLSADYEVSWGQLFQRLVNFFFPKPASIETWDDKEMAVIKGKGCVLGEVSLVKSDGTWEDRQNIDVVWKNVPRYSPKEGKWISHWIIQASAKSIQVGDVVCLLQGALRPTILRLCNDYWTIVMIAVAPSDNPPTTYIKWSELLQSTTTFPNDLLLVWDWDISPVELQDGEDYEYVMDNRVPRRSKTNLENYLDKETRLWNIVLILRDIKRYEEARGRARKVLEALEKALKSMGSLELTYPGHSGRGGEDGEKLEIIVNLLIEGKSGWTPLCLAADDGHEAIVKLLLYTGKANLDVKNEDGQTSLTLAAKNKHEAVVQLLLNTGKVDLDVKDEYGWTPLIWAVKIGHETVVKLLLDTGKVDPDIKDKNEWTPLIWAAKNGHEAVVKLLLDIGKVDPNRKDAYGWTPLWWAAENGHEAVVNLLLDTGKVDPDIKDKNEWTPLIWAAKNGHEAVVKLLLDTGKVDLDVIDKWGMTAKGLAARHGPKAVVNLLLDTGKFNF